MNYWNRSTVADSVVVKYEWRHFVRPTSRWTLVIIDFVFVIAESAWCRVHNHHHHLFAENENLHRALLKGSVKEPNKFHNMKLRKSLIKPVTRQNISSCLVLPREIVTHDAFNIILWMSADICIVVHDDLGWKNGKKQHVIIGFGELAT